MIEEFLLTESEKNNQNELINNKNQNDNKIDKINLSLSSIQDRPRSISECISKSMSNDMIHEHKNNENLKENEKIFNDTKWFKLYEEVDSNDFLPTKTSVNTKIDKKENESFDIVIKDGKTNLIFTLSLNRKYVIVKSFQNCEKKNNNSMILSMQSNVIIPDGYCIKSGLILESINGILVYEEYKNAIEILDLLGTMKRPIKLKLTNNSKNIDTCINNVICRLCEETITIKNIEEHTKYCIKIKMYENDIKRNDIELQNLINTIEKNLIDCINDPLSHSQFIIIKKIALNVMEMDVDNRNSVDASAKLMKYLEEINKGGKNNELLLSPRSLRKIDERKQKYCIRLEGLLRNKINYIKMIHKIGFSYNVILNNDNIIKNKLSPSISRTMSLDGKTYENMKTTISTELINHDISIKSSNTQSNSETSPKRHNINKVNIEDFEIIKPISKGGYGKVYLAKKKKTGDRYAIKILAKEHILRKNQLSNVSAERDILVNAQSPFVVSLYWTFQSKKNLFLVMEYLPGGDLMSLLDQLVRLEEEVAKVYAAEILLALNFLHSIGCVHRDLKPDNILIDINGHIKLTDFGLSEEAITIESTKNDINHDVVSDKSISNSEIKNISTHDDSLDVEDVLLKYDEMDIQNNNRGTPDYISPEIILGLKHDKSVDYWSFGIILYEMLVGVPPFNDQTIKKIFDNIIHHNIIYPDDMSDDAKDLIQLLLEPNPEKRLLGNQIENDSLSNNKIWILNHSFFNGINWNTIRQEEPPFVPNLKNPNDTSYFDNRNLTEIFNERDEDYLIDTKTNTTLENLSFGSITNVNTNEKSILDKKKIVLSNKKEIENDLLYQKPTTPEAFRTFSFTNMNALIDAAKNEVNNIIHNHMMYDELNTLELPCVQL